MADEIAPLVWLDLHTSGPDPAQDRILENAVMISNDELETTARGPELVVDDSADAESEVLEFLSEHTAEGASPAAGDAVWRDRRFLAVHMPRLQAFLHYRLIDVSTVRELARRWFPEVVAPARDAAAGSLAELDASISELRHYRDHVLSRPADPRRAPDDG